MVKNGNLTSDQPEAISKISEVGRLLAPLTSSTFEELSTSSRESPQVNSPTVNSEVSDPQSIAPSRYVNQELWRLFPMLRGSNEQASLSRLAHRERERLHTNWNVFSPITMCILTENRITFFILMSRVFFFNLAWKIKLLEYFFEIKCNKNIRALEHSFFVLVTHFLCN